MRIIINTITCKTMLVILLLVLCNVSPIEAQEYEANIIYVDDNAIGANVGLSWMHAFNSLQDALLIAHFSDEPVEIRVARGTYTPDRGLGIMPGDREVSFQLINGVNIKGGYAGFGLPNPNERNYDLYETILSGDLIGDDVEVANPRDLLENPNRDDNSFHVVVGNGTDYSAVLNGFTITAGNANGASQNSSGGGIYNNAGNPTLINCMITRNTATDGGGMYNNNSNPMLLNCIFNDNSAGLSGGGMYNDNSSPTSTNCTFIGNNAGGGGGGGMYNTHSVLMLADCIFSGNITEGSGAGMHNNTSNAELLNCTFIANSSQRSGGGIYSNSQSELGSTNCIFSRNSALNGGAIESLNGSNSRLLNCTFGDNSAKVGGGGLSNTQDGRLTLTFCILWGDTPDEINGSAYVSYSDIENGWHRVGEGNEGNFDIDPQFANPGNGDYHLKSQTGRWDPAGKSWVIDEVSSPCIDAGHPVSPVGLERFPNGGRINIGAYGGTPQASLSPQQPLSSRGRASNPDPPDGAVDVSRNVTLSWTPGLNAVSHNIYLGTNIPPLFVGNQIGTEFDPGLLDYNRTYYWRIDEVVSEGEIITGAVWSFTTTPSPGTPKGRSCFTGNTPVWINGMLIPISKVVLSRSIDCIGESSVIEEVQEHKGTFTCYDILLESGNFITVAENHYFMAESGKWLSVQELKAGTKLQISSGSIEIVSVTKRPSPYMGKVYNLKVKGSDQYLVGEDAVIVRDY